MISQPSSVTYGMPALRSACTPRIRRARHALGLQHLHVLGVELVDHRRAHHHRQAADRGQREADRRQDEVRLPRSDAGLEPRQLDREEDQQHAAEEELRHRQPDQARAW